MATSNRYKFVRGAGDDPHTTALNLASKDGYKAVLIVVDDSRRGSNQEAVVLMEQENQ